MNGEPGGKGGVSVIDFTTRKVVQRWPIPGGGSPDMGNVSADGKFLWLSGRFDDVVYRFHTDSGDVDTVRVGREPHGLTVWPLHTWPYWQFALTLGFPSPAFETPCSRSRGSPYRRRTR